MMQSRHLTLRSIRLIHASCINTIRTRNFQHNTEQSYNQLKQHSSNHTISEREYQEIEAQRYERKQRYDRYRDDSDESPPPNSVYRHTFRQKDRRSFDRSSSKSTVAPEDVHPFSVHEPWPDIAPSFWLRLKETTDMMFDGQANASLLFREFVDSCEDPRLALIVYRRWIFASLNADRLSAVRTLKMIKTWHQCAQSYPEYKASHCITYIASHSSALSPNDDCVMQLFQFAHYQNQRLNRCLSMIKDQWVVPRKLKLTPELTSRMIDFVNENMKQALPELKAWFALCQNMIEPGSPCDLNQREFSQSITELINDEFYIEAASALAQAAAMRPPFFVDDLTIVEQLANTMITQSLSDRFKLNATTALCYAYDHILDNTLRLRLLLQVGCVPPEIGPRMGLEQAIVRLETMDLTELSPQEDVLMQRILHQFMLEFVKQKRIHLAPSFLNMVQSRGKTMPLSAISSLITAAVNAGRSTDALLLFHYFLQHSEASNEDVRRLLSISLASFVSLSNEDALHSWIKKAIEVELAPTASMVRSLIRAIDRLSTASCGLLLLDIFTFASSSHSSNPITSTLFDDFLRASVSLEDVHCTRCLLEFKQEFGLPCNDSNIVAALAPFASKDMDEFVALTALLPLDFLFDVDAMTSLIQHVDQVKPFCTSFEKLVVSTYSDPLIQLQLRCNIIVPLVLRRKMRYIEDLTFAVKSATESSIVHEVIDSRLRAILATCHRKMCIDKENVFSLIKLHKVLRELGFPPSANYYALLLHDTANIAQSIEATQEVIADNMSTSNEWTEIVNHLNSSPMMTPLLEQSAHSSTPDQESRVDQSKPTPEFYFSTD